MRSQLHVADSSAWLAYLADEPRAFAFAAAIEDPATLIVPTICLAEVFKVFARERDESDALQAVALMQQGRVIDLDSDLALDAAALGLEHGLPLADSIVYATAKRFDALLWTQDEDFDGLDSVRFFPKRKR